MQSTFPILPSLTSVTPIKNAIFETDLMPLFNAMETALGPIDVRDHMKVDIRMPRGALHFGYASAIGNMHWEPAEIRLITSSGTVLILVILSDFSDLSHLQSKLTHWSSEEADFVIRIDGIYLSLCALRHLIIQVLNCYAPFSVSVTTTE